QKIVLMRASPAQRVVQRSAVLEIVACDYREHVRVHPIMVGIGAVEVGWINGWRVSQEQARGVGRRETRKPDGGYAAVRHVVLVDVQVADVHGGRRAQSEC